MHSRILLPLLFVAALPWGAAKAQSRWTLTPEIGMATFSGASHGTSSGIDLGGHPSGMTTGGFRFEKEKGSAHIALGLLLGKPGIQVKTTDGLAVTLNDQFTFVEVRPEVVLPVTRVGREGDVRIALGPTATLSHIVQGSTRLLLGGFGALSVVLPVSPGVAADVRYELAVTQSPFQASDLPAELTASTMWRRRLALGLRLGL